MMLRQRILLDQKQNIVVLDDDEDALGFLKTLLKSFENSCNIKYYDYPTKDFCNYVSNNHIDLFVMDIRLGKFENGIKLSEDIIYKKRGSIFLFISGYDYNEKDFEHLNGKCVYDFIKKPLNIEQFIIVTTTLLNVASTYKISFKNTKPISSESVDDLRRGYFKQLEEDKILIKRLKECSLNLDIPYKE